MKPKHRSTAFTVINFVDYFLYRTILARDLHDKSVIPLMGQLTGDTLELGAGKHNYAQYAQNTKSYIRSDYAPGLTDDRIEIDATNIAFSDNSFDTVVCLSALEHIYDFSAVLREISRVLRPGGSLLLCTPWVFPFHGAPDDYYRFSSSALRSLLSDFEIMNFEAVGNFWLTQAVFLQRPVWSRHNQNKTTRFYDYFLRLMGILFLMIGSRTKALEDDNYALLYTCLACKRT